jgi:UDP-N-acetylmuramate--alanine ligase
VTKEQQGKLLEAGFSPTAAIGGILRNIDTNACLGNGDFFVAEADESDGSFLYYKPKMSIITNIDYEHMDHYKNFNNELEAFGQFINRTEENGCVFCCDDDINLKNALKGYKNKYVLFGLSPNAHIYPRNIQVDGLSSRFECLYNGKFVDNFYLALGGMHNVSNALSVIALGLELGIELKIIKKTLADYKGASRRMEVKFNGSGYLVIDDYAHHPTEIKATLQAVKNIKSNRIIAVFQPHRYTRTQLLLNEFSRSFDMADCVIITDIYAACEQPLEGVTARCLCDRIKAYSPDKQISFLPKDKLVQHILSIIKPSDLVITLGAGDITKTCDELVEELKMH